MLELFFNLVYCVVLVSSLVRVSNNFSLHTGAVSGRELDCLLVCVPVCITMSCAYVSGDTELD